MLAPLTVLAAAMVPAVALAGSSTTTVALSAPESAYGQSVTATATVAASSGAAEGDVVFSVDGLARKVNLGANGTATLVLPRATVGEHSISATYVPFPASDQGSASPIQRWVVSQVRTRLQVRVIGRGARIPTSVQVSASGEYGTRPTGRVKVVVRRIGTRDSTRVVTRLSTTGGALAALGRLDQGHYRLAVTYVGDSQHLRETSSGTFYVRRR
ncbi:Ig-like domain (group 3) [Nocardioides alpinus]|uniref:Ig-like domain (Group 3) n=1 Tax=Nocardioides alpinus TaxID=748909 RepID=A0A1I0XZ34_9ACTN|nr:Ig-like domain-containing protein [Nocardioides alpinus]PKH42766.1 hypothetical protein CXG46_05760 [Nocardioides alpinus]SFB05937.1 Ig-like domain (group 3) [Nocardioides alpinus]